MKLLLKPFQLLYLAWMGITYLLFMLILFPCFIFVNLVFDEMKAISFVVQFIRWWATWWCFLCGIKMEVFGREKVPVENCYIFVSNHCSSLDAMLWAYANSHIVKGLAKKELLKIPLLGYFFRKTSVIVDRSSPESRARSIASLKEQMMKGVSIFMFPEGTRNRTDKPMTPFYDGAFRLAIETQKPIAPVVMCNTGILMPASSFFYKPGTIKCFFLNPIPAEGLTVNDMESLKGKVFSAMEKSLLENDDRFKNKTR